MKNFDKQKVINEEDGSSEMKDPTWQNKTEGFKQMMTEIGSQDPDGIMLEATAKFVKANCKDWKENNPNMQKEALNVVKTMTEHCERIPKRVLHTYSLFMCEKIGDIKIAKPISELFISLSEFMTCKFVAGYIVKNGAKTKIPKNI